MLSVVSPQPVNLPAAADLSGLLDERGSAQVLGRSRLAFTLHGLDGVEAIAESAETDILYIIISGYRMLRCADGSGSSSRQVMS